MKARISNQIILKKKKATDPDKICRKYTQDSTDQIKDAYYDKLKRVKT
jgi:hypothetical protein